MKIGTDGVLLGAWAPTPPAPPAEIWDVGAGTGLIALMAAQRFPHSHITAIEIEENAAGEALDNIKNSPWADRIRLVKGDIKEVAPTLPAPEMIISNPPFYKEDIQSPDKRRNTARHESSLPLETLISLASASLPKGGSLAFIAPYSRIEEIEYIAFLKKIVPTHLVPVISKEGNMAGRVLVNLIKEISPSAIENEPIIIRDLSGNYTDGYRSITAEFYTHLK